MTALNGGGPEWRRQNVQGGYQGDNIEATAPELARLAAHHLIRFIALRAHDEGLLGENDSVQALAAWVYIRDSDDGEDAVRALKMLEEVQAEPWVYKGKGE